MLNPASRCRWLCASSTRHRSTLKQTDHWGFTAWPSTVPYCQKHALPDLAVPRTRVALTLRPARRANVLLRFCSAPVGTRQDRGWGGPSHKPSPAGFKRAPPHHPTQVPWAAGSQRKQRSANPGDEQTPLTWKKPSVGAGWEQSQKRPDPACVVPAILDGGGWWWRSEE